MAMSRSFAKSNQPSAEAFFKPTPIRPTKRGSPRPKSKLEVQASLKKKVVMGLMVAALTVSMVILEVAEAAGAGISPSLKNFVLSSIAGGVVLTSIVGAFIGVSNFDPMKRS